MAAVQVNSLAEFVTAVSVAGDTVVCPEGADWDANDTYPDGYSGDILWRASVLGNGTTIRNLHLYGRFTSNGSSARQYLDSLRIVDLIGSASPRSEAGLFDGNFHFQKSALSAVLNSNYWRIVRWWDWSTNRIADKSSFNVDAAGNFDTFYQGAVRYCRIELHLPNSVWYPYYAGADMCEQSELAIFAPNAGNLQSKQFSGCIIHGELPRARERGGGSTPSDMTLFSVDGLPNFVPDNPAQCRGVTDAQLRDPAYLRSIGFPIAIEG